MTDPDKSPERDQDDAYLWDRSGAVDPEVARLETLLAPLAHRRELGPLPVRTEKPKGDRGAPKRGAVIAIGAGVLALAAASALWFSNRAREPLQALRGGVPALGTVARIEGPACALPVPGLAFKSIEGAPTCGGERAAATGTLPIDAWLETDASSRVTISVADIGQVEIDPSSRVRVKKSGEKEHRLELERGRLKATIDAPPRLFFVDTKAATAIDLGCEYELRVDETGNGLLRVTKGFVELEPPQARGAGRRRALVPRNAEARIDARLGPGTPLWSRSNTSVHEGVHRFDATGSSEDLSNLLPLLGPRDTLTLFHLLTRASADDRPRILEILERIAGLPKGVDRAATLRLDDKALDAWQAALEPRWFPK